MKEDYIKIPVRNDMRDKGFSKFMDSVIPKNIFLHKDMAYYLIESLALAPDNVETKSISYDAPKGYRKIYINKDDIIKKIKATDLAKKMYPDSKEVDGYLLIIKELYIK